jgi:hypothetical protein
MLDFQYFFLYISTRIGVNVFDIFMILNLFRLLPPLSHTDSDPFMVIW